MASRRESPFWQFSLELYAHREVEKCCLQLQDNCGIDVNVLLYILWLASRQRQVGNDDIVAMDAAVTGWRTQVVVPLRGIRRALQAPGVGCANSGENSFRDRIKAVELEAEKVQQDLLFGLKSAGQWGTAQADSSVAARENLHAYESVLGVEFDIDAQETLVAALLSN